VNGIKKAVTVANPYPRLATETSSATLQFRLATTDTHCQAMVLFDHDSPNQASQLRDACTRTKYTHPSHCLSEMLRCANYNLAYQAKHTPGNQNIALAEAIFQISAKGRDSRYDQAVGDRQPDSCSGRVEPDGYIAQTAADEIEWDLRAWPRGRPRSVEIE
jgi:hypothetical protein